MKWRPTGHITGRGGAMDASACAERTESWGAVVVDKPPDSPAEREPGRVHAAAQSDGMTATSQAEAAQRAHQRVQRCTESWGAVVVDKPPDSPAEREPGRVHAVAQRDGMTVTAQAVAE